MNVRRVVCAFRDELLNAIPLVGWNDRKLGLGDADDFAMCRAPTHELVALAGNILALAVRPFALVASRAE